jgi:hypothetical protein
MPPRSAGQGSSLVTLPCDSAPVGHAPRWTSQLHETRGRPKPPMNTGRFIMAGKIGSGDDDEGGLSDRRIRGRTHYCALRERLTLASTVGRELGKRRSAQRFPMVHGKDGVAGSIPAGGSTKPMTSANAGHLRVWGWFGRQLVVRFVSDSCRSAKDRNENAYLHNRWGSLRRASGIRGDEAPTSIGHTGGRDHRLGMRVPLPRFGRQ